ncbi:methyltransferase [Solwaraspora sp. WMMB335]|uniref:methyltransferase n=1 Tax=Solwaraspora sp. WMMB335 TaxID=3404118 RepID=UPI003B95581A
MLTPTPLMRLVTGFWSFKTLAAAVELDLFTRLSGGRSITVAELCDEYGLAERPADTLLAACASIGLLTKQPGEPGYRNSPIAEEFLVTGRPYYFGGQIRYCDERTYLPWHRIGDALRTNRPLTWDPHTQESVFADVDPQMLTLFFEAMYATSMFTARALAQEYDFGAHRRLLDLGGGSGAYPIEMCRRHPRLRASVYDLPHVVPIAAEKAEAAGLGDRIDTIAGDFFVDPELPQGHDVMLLSMVLHDWDEPTNRVLLERCHDALPAGGTIVVAELLLNPERTGPAEAALMGMNMLVETIGGRNYSETEYADWLADAGFGSIRTVTFDAPGANGALIARRR